MSTEYLILRLDQQQTKAEVAFKVPCLCQLFLKKNSIVLFMLRMRQNLRFSFEEREQMNHKYLDQKVIDFLLLINSAIETCIMDQI